MQVSIQSAGAGPGDRLVRDQGHVGPGSGTSNTSAVGAWLHGRAATGRTSPAALAAPFRYRHGVCGAVASATRRRRGRGGRAARIRAATGLFSLRECESSSKPLACQAIQGLSAAHRTPRAAQPGQTRKHMRMNVLMGLQKDMRMHVHIQYHEARSVRGGRPEGP